MNITKEQYNAAKAIQPDIMDDMVLEYMGGLIQNDDGDVAIFDFGVDVTSVLLCSCKDIFISKYRIAAPIGHRLIRLLRSEFQKAGLNSGKFIIDTKAFKACLAEVPYEVLGDKFDIIRFAQFSRYPEQLRRNLLGKLVTLLNTDGVMFIYDVSSEELANDIKMFVPTTFTVDYDQLSSSVKVVAPAITTEVKPQSAAKIGGIPETENPVGADSSPSTEHSCCSGVCSPDECVEHATEPETALEDEFKKLVKDNESILQKLADFDAGDQNDETAESPEDTTDDPKPGLGVHREYRPTTPTEL